MMQYNLSCLEAPCFADSRVAMRQWQEDCADEPDNFSRLSEVPQSDLSETTLTRNTLLFSALKARFSDVPVVDPVLYH